VLYRDHEGTKSTKTHEEDRSVPDFSSSCRLHVLRVFVVNVAFTFSACAAHHTTTGLIVRTEQTGGTVTISHDAFPGFMDAMVMPFDMKGSARAAKLTPGDRVKFRLAMKGGRSWVDRVEVISAAPVDAGLQNTPAVPVLVPVGTAMPTSS
jgi:Uncharacterized conserved protein